jgi:membrane dipeptidase
MSPAGLPSGRNRRAAITATPMPVFDGHNDVLLRLHRKADARSGLFFARGETGHLDLPRALEGGFAGGLFAVFVPSPGGENAARGELPEDPAALGFERAHPVATAMTARLFRLERAAGGQLRVARTAGDIRRAMADGILAAVLHLEGAEAIDPGLDALEVLYRAGLRSLGPVWSRPNVFGHGVPFRHPSSPDTGPGLTEAGVALVRACNELRIVVDLSHLNERGFWDVARVSRAPLVASHSNAHALCASARNLTDDQLRAVRDSGGLVGVNFATCFIRADGRNDPTTSLDELLRHVDHLLERLGEGGVGLGSDFDGAMIPSAIGDAAGLPRLVQALRDHGFGEQLVRRIAHENWLDLLQRTWGE